MLKINDDSLAEVDKFIDEHHLKPISIQSNSELCLFAEVVSLNRSVLSYKINLDDWSKHEKTSDTRFVYQPGSLEKYLNWILEHSRQTDSNGVHFGVFSQESIYFQLRQQFVEIYKTVVVHDKNGTTNFRFGQIPRSVSNKIRCLANLEWQLTLGRFARLGLKDKDQVLEIRIYFWNYNSSYFYFGNKFVDSTIRQHMQDHCEEKRKEAHSILDSFRQSSTKRLQ